MTAEIAAVDWQIGLEPDQLTAALARLDPGREVAGNTPFLIDRPALATFIAAGTVDVFLVELEAGQPAGTRHYCCSLHAGDLMFGVDGTQGPVAVGLLAVGTIGTRVLDLPLQTLIEVAAMPHRGRELAAMVDRWVAALSEVAVRTIVPQPFVDLCLTPGERLKGQGNQRVSVTHEVAWMVLSGGAPLFLDSQDVSASSAVPFPLCPRSWISLGKAAEIEGVRTEAVLRDGRLWAGLQGLHEAVMDVAPLMSRLAAADEANRLRLRVAADENALARGTARLKAIVRADAARDPPGEIGTRLFEACNMLARTMGIALVAPSPSATPDKAPSLDDILQANRLRKRTIRLEGSWWRQDIGSFLLLGAEGEAVAVLRTRHGYAIGLPATGETKPLAAADAARLEGTAFVFYEPLPVAPLAVRDLVRIILRWGRGELAVVGVFSLASSILALATPIAIGVMIDAVIPDRDTPRLFEMAAVLLVTVLVQLTVSVTLQRAVLRLEGILGTRLQVAVIDRLLRLPTRFFRDFTAGDLATRALAIQRIQNVLTGSLFASLLTGSAALTSFGLMFFYSGLLGGVALAIGAAFTAASVMLNILRLRHESEIAQLRGRVSGELLELTTGIAKLRLAAAEQRVFGRWAATFAALETRTSNAKRVGLFNELLSVSMRTLALVGLFAVIVYSRMVEGGLAIGQLVAFLAAFNQGLSGLVQISQTALELVALRPIFRHASPILGAVPEMANANRDPGILTGAIELSHINFRYASDAPRVFEDLSLHIRAGEYVAIVGPSGCGKSTILRILLGFEVPERGAVLYDGRDLRGLNAEAVRRQTGVVLQNSRLVGSTLLDNILGANVHLTEEEAWRAATQAGLDNDIRSMPMGMHTLVSEGTLSGGQLQRVAIARALISEPRIIILDEATSALDNRTQAIVTASLERLRATRIVVAHRLSTVMSADRIVVIEDGRVAENDSYEALVNAGGVFSKLVERQLVRSTR